MGNAHAQESRFLVSSRWHCVLYQLSIPYRRHRDGGGSRGCRWMAKPSRERGPTATGPYYGGGHPEDSQSSCQTGMPGESSPRRAGSSRYTRSAMQLVGRYVRERECVNGELEESRVMGRVAL